MLCSALVFTLVPENACTLRLLSKEFHIYDTRRYLHANALKHMLEYLGFDKYWKKEESIEFFFLFLKLITEYCFEFSRFSEHRIHIPDPLDPFISFQKRRRIQRNRNERVYFARRAITSKYVKNIVG